LNYNFVISDFVSDLYNIHLFKDLNAYIPPPNIKYSVPYSRDIRATISCVDLKPMLFAHCDPNTGAII